MRFKLNTKKNRVFSLQFITHRLKRFLVAGSITVVAAHGAIADDRARIAFVGTDTVIPTFNTQLTSSTAPLTIADVWADGLLSYRADGTLEGHLAESWAVSKDGMEITFNLRGGVKWSDGEPFTAADVKFTIEEVAKLNTYQRAMVSVVSSVETPDDNTVVIKLNSPFSPIIKAFDKEIFPIVAKHIYDGSDIANNPANRAPVGLGPYKFHEMEEGVSVTFVRNEHYWGAPRPYLEAVVFALIPDGEQRFNALVSGEIDAMVLAHSQVKRAQQLDAEGKIKFLEIENASPERLVVDVNTRRELLANKLVRQALLVATDRNQLIENSLQGHASPAINAIPHQFAALTPDNIDYNEIYAFDQERAGKMLDEAGYPLKGGKRFDIEITYPEGSEFSPIFRAAAQTLAGQWAQIGIQVEIAGLDNQIWRDKVYTRHDFDLNLITMTSRSDPVLGVDRGHLCNDTDVAYVNPTGYCNPELDELAAAARMATSDAERKEHYTKYAQIVAEDLNQIALTNTGMAMGFSTRFDDIELEFELAFDKTPDWSYAKPKN